MLTQYSRKHQGIHGVLLEMVLFIKQTSAVIPPYFFLSCYLHKTSMVSLKCDIFQRCFDKSMIQF